MNFICFGSPPDDPGFRQGYWLQVYLMTMSALRAHPDNRVIFITDPKVDVSAKIPFSDVFRVAGDPAELMVWRTRAWIDYLRARPPKIPTIFLDPDILVQRNPKDAFAGSFDLGVTWNNPRAEIGNKINSGVVFCPPTGRADAFFDKVLDRMADMSADRRRWLGEQEAIANLLPPHTFDSLPPPQVAVDDLTVRLLPCAEWNFFPSVGTFYNAPVPTADSFRAAPYRQPLLHFKGHRKNYMLLYAESVLSIELPAT